jgi:hypothetical protein
MEGNNGEKINIHERIARLETKVDTILTNHIPHLETSVKATNDKVDELKIWQAKIMVIFAVIVFLITIFGDKLSRMIFK